MAGLEGQGVWADGHAAAGDARGLAGRRRAGLRAAARVPLGRGELLAAALLRRAAERDARPQPAAARRLRARERREREQPAKLDAHVDVVAIEAQRAAAECAADDASDAATTQAWAKRLKVPYAGQSLGPFTNTVLDQLLRTKQRRYLSDAEKEAMDNALQAKEKEAAEKEMEGTELQATIRRLEAEGVEREKKVAELDKKIDMKDVFKKLREKKRLKSVLSSRSIRLTKGAAQLLSASHPPRACRRHRIARPATASADRVHQHDCGG